MSVKASCNEWKSMIPAGIILSYFLTFDANEWYGTRESVKWEKKRLTVTKASNQF